MRIVNQNVTTAKLPHLPESDLCCGCGACVDTCSKEALSLREDEDGFLDVWLDADKCVGCGLCERHCHLLNQSELKRSNPREVKPVAGWSTNEELIARSASGGIFAQLAYDMLGIPDTYVYGAALLPDSSVRHIEIASRDQLSTLQNSKYQQSDTTGIYRQVKRRLQEGARVLFSGVPCQIAALHSYLGSNEALKERLYTLEVLCHGVPTGELHRTALRLNGAKRIVSYRTKRNTGWIGNNNRLTYETEHGELTPRRYVYDFLFRAYLQFSFTRPGCYQCRYGTMPRVADITVGDFWGWQHSAESQRYRNYMGVSIVLPNTAKGQSMIYSSASLHVEPVRWQDILPYNQNLFMPTNDYLFAGGRWVHHIRKMPLRVQKFIYQNGFSVRYVDALWRCILSVLLFARNRRIKREVRSRMQETLTSLER